MELKTGHSMLDKAIEKYGLSFGKSCKTPIQTTVFITKSATAIMKRNTLKNAGLIAIPHCIGMAITENTGIYVNFVTTPDGKALCWSVISEDGRLVEQVYCRHKGQYPLICRRVVGYLLLNTAQTVAA